MHAGIPPNQTPRSRRPPRNRHPPRAGIPPEQTPYRRQAPPWSRHPPPWADNPPKEALLPRAGTSPSRHPLPRPANGYCCGRYASYWNAFLYLTMKLYFNRFPRIYFQIYAFILLFLVCISKFWLCDGQECILPPPIECIVALKLFSTFEFSWNAQCYHVDIFVLLLFENK